MWTNAPIARRRRKTVVVVVVVVVGVVVPVPVVETSGADFPARVPRARDEWPST
jgi:hypothetical protein